MRDMPHLRRTESVSGVIDHTTELVLSGAIHQKQRRGRADCWLARQLPATRTWATLLRRAGACIYRQYVNLASVRPGRQRIPPEIIEWRCEKALAVSVIVARHAPLLQGIQYAEAAGLLQGNRGVTVPEVDRAFQ